ncbi:hypothetical protein HPB50_006365 [Hyalomma asiaticum]|uniref:Uncharacterized protein n=1 Tax=Hyalomma asiaticum TaxID=266040 RepID=A0ACB7RZ48_HYAAI|nr:hypothetical protein HPB50_006365 [Hyalomma asiaticum]
MTGDFLTTAFPVVLVLVASDKFGREQTLTLEVFPEFKLYNVSLWSFRHGECGDPAYSDLVSWKREYLESSVVVRYDGLPGGQYCVTADPIAERCFPSDFCHRLVTSTFYVKAAAGQGGLGERELSGGRRDAAAAPIDAAPSWISGSGLHLRSDAQSPRAPVLKSPGDTVARAGRLAMTTPLG